MSECDYLLWLSYKSFRRILFTEGTTTIGYEVFQAPICTTQAIATYTPLRQPLEFSRVTVNGQKLQSWNLAPTGFEHGQ